MEYDLSLRNIGRLITLTEEEEAYFCSLLQVRKYKRRQFLVQAGDICRYENFIQKGCVRSYYADDSGFEHTVQFGVEDWWIGDFASFVTQTPAKLNVEALEDCEIIQIEFQALEELYRQVPKFERFFRLLFQRSFITLQNRIISMISMTAEERYLEFRQKYAVFESRIPQTKIASYLGITPEFLSKIRSQLAKNH